VIECIESLLASLTKPTVLVLDKAVLYRSKAVQEKRKDWRKRGLRLLLLPQYCPQLNRIEILWGPVTYRWLAPGVYR
jgi:transposase